MATKTMTTKEYFNSLTTTHAGMTFGQIIFGGAVWYLNLDRKSESALGDLEGTFQIIVPLLVFAGLLGGFYLFAQQLKRIRTMETLRLKLGNYRTNLIIKYALWEGPALLSIVCYLLTSNVYFVAIAGFVIVVFLLQRPTKNQLIKDLQLSQKDQAVLSNPDAVVAEVKYG